VQRGRRIELAKTFGNTGIVIGPFLQFWWVNADFEIVGQPGV
jgi:hypothetical protein